MKKLIFFLALVALLLVAKASVAAKSDGQLPPGIEDRGPLTKITFIHYRHPEAKPSGVTKNKPATCYAFLAKGARWKNPENYVLNLSGTSLPASFVENVFNLSTAEWENYGGNIFKEGTRNDSATYDTSKPDNHNVVVFANYPDNRVIAVATVWGYFSGPLATRELVEWDMLFNNVYQWGDATENNAVAVMDLQNIATHELGHSAGMNDLYNTCTLETMYGYSREGEIIKRDLNLGDQTGIKALYGY